MNKREPKHKILVLTDLKETTESVLNHATGLAGLVDSEVLFLHVKKPSNIVGGENQFSAMRSINKDYVTTSKRIADLADHLGESVNYNLVYGSVRGEIRKVLNDFKPDTVILGKRKPKFAKLIGDGVTDFVLRKHDGAVVIAAEGKELSQFPELSLGALNSSSDDLRGTFVSAIMKRSKKPLKVFKTDSDGDFHLENRDTFTANQVEFVFEGGTNIMDKISKYVNKSSVNLLLVTRDKKRLSKTTKSTSSLRNLINKIDMSVLISGKGSERLSGI